MTELDKFKRRTIRSVARLLRQKKPPDELWSEMKKETGTDCRVLWERMRALCIKKLNRMLAVDDRSDSLPSIARLSLTDWLLVDLVLVHEKIDVIAMDKVDNKAEQKPLVQLFNLVQRFDVEGRSGEALAEAWAAATVFYNRQGRQCSPMLLQRRWYQLKKLTRVRFYKFWHTYRGNTRLLAEAKGTMPTRLQMAVAKRYPAVITGAYPEWEELIELKLIILPEEFESKMRVTNIPKPCNSSDPDLVVVEPVIETIELGEDSDSEEPKGDNIEDTTDPDKSNDVKTEASTTDSPLERKTTLSNEVLGVKVKTEPIEEDGLSNVQVVGTTHVTELEIPDETPELDEVPSEVNNENHMSVEEETEDNLDFDDDVMCTDADSPKVDDESPGQPENSETNLGKSGSEGPDSEDDVIEIPSVVPSIDIDLESPTEAPAEEINPIISSVSSTVQTQNVIDMVVDNIIKLKADEYCRKDSEEVPESDVTDLVDDLIKDKVETFLKTPKEDITFEEKKPDVSAINLNAETLDLTAIDLMADLNFNDDGLEFIDDGVEFVEEMEEPKRAELVTEASPDHETTKASDESNKFDLKLLMDPVVYTTKLDHMNIFANSQFDSVDKKEDIEKIIAESKPVSKKSFNINIKEEDSLSQNDDTNTIEDIGVHDDLFMNQESDEDIEEITVSPNSYILKKPRTRSYNPIQLCKNPDFNTKLRRLAIGFFSSPRNRQLLNSCIPMTIDVSKAFESKLVDGTLYLKSSGEKPRVVEEPVIEKETFTSVVPSTLPIQSLLENSKTDILKLYPTPTIDLTPNSQSDTIPTQSINSISSISPAIGIIPSPIPTHDSPIVTERKKIINLPDIEKVRRINQQLLTAQVPPIRVYAGNSYRPPAQPITAVTSHEEPMKLPEVPTTPAEPVSAPILPPQPNILPTVVKVESEATLDNKDGLDPETDIDVPSEPLPPAKQKLIKIINQAKLTTQEALTKIDGGNKTSVSDGLKQLTLTRKPGPKPNAYALKKNMYNRIPVPWTKAKHAPRRENLDDFLITDDTLNKMLHLMSGDEEEKNCACCSLKQRKLEWNKASKAKKKKEALEKKKQEKSQKKEPSIVDLDSKDLPENADGKSKAVLAKGRVVRYCCWANQKICNRKRITKHTCPPDECVCCCRETYARVLEEKKKSAPIELSDDDDKSLKMACESIEKVVQEARESSAVTLITQDETPSTQKLVVMRTISTSTEQSQLETIPTDDSLSLNQAAVNAPEQPNVTPPVITKIIPQNQLSNLFAPRKRQRSKPQSYLPTAKEPLCVPSPYQKPTETPMPQLSIVIDASRNIVLDGSKQGRLHPPPLTPTSAPVPAKDNKILYLHSKSISKSPSESPIFLGKNKILLTTIKFPRKTDEAPLPECEVFQAPKIIPTLPLPTGVQLVLLPTGSVTYTVDQGVELTPEQLETLPTIIAAVQEQLNSSPVPALAPMMSTGQAVSDVAEPDIPYTQTAEVTEAINIDAQEAFQNVELPRMIIRNEELDNMANTSVDKPTAPINTEEIGKAKAISTLSTNETVNSITDDDDAQNTVAPASNDTIAGNSETQSLPESVKPPETPSVAEPEKQAETQSVAEPGTSTETKSDLPNPMALAAAPNTDGADNRKTLLSDLMEMSGISAEDATAAEQTAPEQAPVFINPEQEKSLPELTPVTSFAELKYACEHDGKFFKLDFETGVIVPINVCIKKNPKPKAPARVRAVIDLTDEIDDSNESTITQNSEPPPDGGNFADAFKQYIYKGKTLNVPNTVVKPVKLFKAVHQPSLLKRQIQLDPNLNSTPTGAKQNLHMQKRKQNISRVDTILDLVDSDAPMEEEYLMDSSDTESTQTETEPMVVEALEELDYSSDDEPLAKKSKRMKEAHEETDNDIETNIRDAINVAVSENPDPEPNPSISAGGSNVTKELDVPMASEDTPRDENEVSRTNEVQPGIGPENEPAAESEQQPEMDQDPDLDQEMDPDVDPELRFMSGPSDNEAGDEDCILGV